MTGRQRDEAELDAVLDAASADLGDDARPAPGDEGLLRRAVDGAMARAAASPVRGVTRPVRWQRGVLLAAAALIVTSSALAVVERARVRRTERSVAMTPNDRVQAGSPPPEAVAPAASSAPGVETPPPHSPVSSAASAAELFSEANSARRHGDVPTALRRYAWLQRRFPHSPEAALSRVALGRLYLDELHQPARALAQFDAYLAEASDGLREEALVGRALALQGLGRASEERDAWRTLLEAYPGSLSSDRAKERLRALQ
jgi:TolA-binding protein